MAAVACVTQRHGGVPGELHVHRFHDVEHGTFQVDGSLVGSAVDLGDVGDSTLSGTGTVGAISVGARRRESG